jgi:ketosteroid isomerase-like protein
MNPIEKMKTAQSETQQQIIALEKKLLDAFANKDLQTIDELLHDSSIFVYPNGQMVTKKMVMDNYRSGNSAFTEITSSDQIINLVDDAAIVSINLELKGKYFDEIISSHFRYLRAWKLVNDKWKVIAVSGVPITTK